MSLSIINLSATTKWCTSQRVERGTRRVILRACHEKTNFSEKRNSRDAELAHNTQIQK
jgi:hypothetical protein